MKPKITIIRIQSRICIGGPAIHTALLSSRLDSARFETILVGGALQEGEADFIGLIQPSDDFKIIIIREMVREIRPWKDILSLFKLYKLIKRVKPNIIHSHTAKAGIIGRIAAFLAGVPVIIHTFHGHTFHSYFPPIQSKLIVLVERMLGCITDKIIVISERQFHEICEHYKIAPKRKFSIIPLGLELDRFTDDTNEAEYRSTFRQRWGIKSDALLVGIVGRLVPVKNHFLFLQVVRRVLDMVKQDLNVMFLIIGDGELRDELEDYAKELEIEKNVIFTGWQGQMDIVYASLDIVALTSLNEGTPLTMIEAMAAKRPVIATNVGGVRDVIADGYSGIVVPSNDLDTFANRLLELLKRKDTRERLAANARYSVIRKYHCSRLIRDIEELYNQVLRSS